MNVIDVGVLLDEKSTILNINKKSIMFSKFINNTYCIYETNLQFTNERLIISWPCDETIYDNTKVLVKDNFIYAIVQQKNELIVKKVKHGTLEYEKKYNITGNMLNKDTVLLINEDTIIIFLTEVSTYEYDGFLCDLLEDQSYYISDRSIVDSLKDNFIVYDAGGQQYIVFEENYMKYEEKRQVYDAVKKREVIIGDCFESIKIIKVQDFIESIKNEQPSIPFKTIECVSINGWTRYLGMNKSHIYFRTKDFGTQLEKIYSIDKLRLRKKCVIEINHKKNGDNTRYIYLPQKIQIIKIAEASNIKGILNSNITTHYNNTADEIVDCIDDKIIVLQNILDKTITINNTKMNEIKTYNGKYFGCVENTILINSKT